MTPVENPEKATVARLENYNSGRLFLIVFRDSEFSHFGPICRSIKEHKVDFNAKDEICKALGFDGQGEDTFPDTSIHNLPPVIGRGLATYDSPYNPLFVGKGKNKVSFQIMDENSRTSGCFGHTTDVTLNCIGTNINESGRSTRTRRSNPFEDFKNEVRKMALNDDDYASLPAKILEQYSKMNDEPVWSQWTEWSLSRPHSPRWPEPNKLYRVRNCVRPITDYNGENYHKCPGEFYEVKKNDIKQITPGPTTTEETTIPGTDYTMTDYHSPESSGTSYPPYDSDTGSSGSYDDSYDEPNSYANPYDAGYSSPSVDSVSDPRKKKIIPSGSSSSDSGYSNGYGNNYSSDSYDSGYSSVKRS